MSQNKIHKGGILVSPIPYTPKEKDIRINSAEPWNKKFDGTISTTVVSETTYGQSATAGTSTNAAAGDHTHGTPATPTSLSGLPVYANNAAATGGGLSAGDLYRTGGDPDTVCVVH